MKIKSKVTTVETSEYIDLEGASMPDSVDDLHTKTAAKLFKVEVSGVTPEQRKLAKSYNYGKHYRMSPQYLLHLLGIENDKEEVDL